MLEPLRYTESDMKRLTVIHRTMTGLACTTAAAMLGLSVRQVFRLKAKLRKQGDSGIIHGNRGRRPANAKPAELRRYVLDLHRRQYRKYNACHFAEALEEEHHVKLSRETVRRWFRAAGIPAKRGHRSRSNHRRRRLRSARFGELLFLDGSPHRWLGENRPSLTLILATDDATGKPLRGLFVDQENLNGCLEVLYHVFRRHGLPKALYLDRAGQFTTTRHGGVHRFQRDDKPTHFEVAMKHLGIETIFAHSPQARGRGERINGSFQDRLVAELDHHGIRDPGTATRYLNRHFIPRYARRFGVPSRKPESAFDPAPAGLDLRTVLCARTQRAVTNDNTISHKGRTYQLLPSNRIISLAGAKVEVQDWFDGSIHVFHPQTGEIPLRKLPPTPKVTRRRRCTAYDAFAVHSL